MVKFINYLIFCSLILLYCCKANEVPSSKHENIKPAKPTEIIPKTPEELLKEKLNDTEKTNLQFLKDALNDNDKFNQFIFSNEDKIKAALEHIKTQLESCTEEQKKTFKESIKAYFGQMNNSELDQFNTNVLSLCANGS
ncbi:Mlp family lipoprotein (plasmid) [Borrelia puertoricensis]|uniref:Mlp family lipoprotein n=1 Tax=Borrelia puertoricensis TaxID=2756107 RepID=UPI003EB92B25